MTLSEDIANRAEAIFKTDWKTRAGRVVPSPENVQLGNDAVEFQEATFLYADLDGSTDLVDAKKWQFSAEVYKAFLFAATKLIIHEGGIVTSFDGDRVMGVFLGEKACPSAARCGLKINFAVKNLVQPKMEKPWNTRGFKIKHVVGIDVSPARAVRGGIRHNNDLLWVAPAANHAAKLTALTSDYATRMTKRAFDKLDESTWYSSGADRKVMWFKIESYKVAGHPTYASNWTWTV